MRYGLIQRSCHKTYFFSHAYLLGVFVNSIRIKLLTFLLFVISHSFTSRFQGFFYFFLFNNIITLYWSVQGVQLIMFIIYNYIWLEGQFCVDLKSKWLFFLFFLIYYDNAVSINKYAGTNIYRNQRRSYFIGQRIKTVYILYYYKQLLLRQWLIVAYILFYLM